MNTTTAAVAGQSDAPFASIFARLRAPFPAAEVKWRIGSKSKDGKKASVLAYIDARHVQDRLDEVVGPMNWRAEYHGHPGDVKGGIMCKLSVRVDGEWITKEDGAEATDIEAAKGGISDAFKRAAVQFGIGRYLYAVEAPWVDLDNGYLPRGFDGSRYLAGRTGRATTSAPAQETARPAARAAAPAPAAPPPVSVAPAPAPAPVLALDSADVPGDDEQALMLLDPTQAPLFRFVMQKLRDGRTSKNALRHAVGSDRYAAMPVAVRQYILNCIGE